MFVSVLLYDWYVADGTGVGFLVALLGLTLLFFDRDWSKKGWFDSPF